MRDVEAMTRRTPSKRAAARGFTPNPRQSDLVAAVREHGAMTVEAMAERFGVTLQTVRRDVGLLSDAGLLARYHGGARIPSLSSTCGRTSRSG